MGAMRKFKTKNVLPEFERTLEIRYRDAGVIGRDNAKWHVFDCGGRRLACGNIIAVGDRCRHRRIYLIAAMTFSSIAIGVGSAVTSTVVRVGFGLPSPAKYSA